jgi:hypothetical protein
MNSKKLSKSHMNDLIEIKNKNKLINLNYLSPQDKYSEEQKNQMTIDAFNKVKKNNNKNSTFSGPLNLKKIKLKSLNKENKHRQKIKRLKFTSQLSSLKYYLLYSQPGIGKKSLQNIYEDLDNIEKKIDNYEENEEIKINNFEKMSRNYENLIENKMIVNIPDFSSKNKNFDGFLGFCGTYDKYNHDMSKIKNLFGTKINLLEKKQIIKNMLKNNELNSNTINNYYLPKKKLKLFYPSISNKNNNNTHIFKENKSFDKSKINKNFFNRNNKGTNPNNLKGINFSKKYTRTNDEIILNRIKNLNKQQNNIINKTVNNFSNIIKSHTNKNNVKNIDEL